LDLIKEPVIPINSLTILKRFTLLAYLIHYFLRTGTIVCKEDSYLITLHKQGFDKILGKFKEQQMKGDMDYFCSFEFF